MNALARQRIEVRRQGRHEGLALAGAHLGDLALVQRHAADQLHVEMAHAQRAARRLADHREGLGKQGIESRAGGEAGPEVVGADPQLFVGELPELGLQGIGGLDLAGKPLQ